VSGAALVLQGVRKAYGKRVALAGLDLAAPRGAITGLVGPNGAGKTTCFGIVGGLLAADAGRVDVLGQGRFDAATQAGRLGLLPQDAELPGHARVDVMLRYFARLQGLTRIDADREVARVLELMALSDRARSRVRELSHGMRRRVAVAQALLGDPELVLLDEPTSGLDPHLVVSVREVLRAQRDRGITLVVSSHVLSDLEAICDHVVFIEAGRAIKSGSLAVVTGRGQVVRFTLAEPPALGTLQPRLPDLSLRASGVQLVVEAPPDCAIGALNRRVLRELLALDASVLEIRLGHSLEQAYLDERGRAEGTRPS
jgi:ABC-type multidrug transport system ATPase subunit